MNPAEKVTLLVSNHDSTRATYLVTYIIFGIVLALELYARLREGTPALAQAATAVGLIQAFVLVASGMIVNAGMGAVVGLHLARAQLAHHAGVRLARYAHTFRRMGDDPLSRPAGRLGGMDSAY